MVNLTEMEDDGSVRENSEIENIAKELGLRKVDFRFSQSGSRVIFVGD